MSEELKPCPFCGGRGVESIVVGIKAIMCENANCSMGAMEVDEWNTRPIEDVLKAANVTASQIIADLQEENDALKSSVSNLLATIHQDGGAFETENGTDAACVRAQRIYTALNAYNDALITANEAQAGEIERLTEDRDSEKRWAGVYHAKWQAAEDEVARLRAALAMIAEQQDRFGPPYDRLPKDIAKDALAEVK